MLLVRAALPSRFNELRRPEVAAYLEVRAREGPGHDRFALKDLRALGVPGELSTGALVKTSRTVLRTRPNRKSAAGQTGTFAHAEAFGL
jgi:hypothetical protein